MDEKLIVERKKLLDRLGWVPEPVIENKEWLYLQTVLGFTLNCEIYL